VEKTFYKVFRDAKGRFSKFDRRKYLRPSLFSTKTHKEVSKGNLKRRKRDYTFTGAIGYTLDGKRVKSPVGHYVFKGGRVYVDGVMVCRLRSNRVLTKKLYKIVTSGFFEKPVKEKIWMEKYRTKEDLLAGLYEAYKDEYENWNTFVKKHKNALEGEREVHAGLIGVGASGLFDGGRLKYLRKLRSDKRRKVGNWLVVDSEDDTHGNVKLVVFYNGENFTVFQGDNIVQLRYEISLFLQSISKYRPKIFAVGMEYDLGNLFGEYFKEFEPIFTGGFCIHAKLIFSKNRYIEFFDGYVQTRLSVKEMGELIGLEKLDVKTEEKVNLEYCKRDCEIVYRGMEKLFKFDEEHRIDFGLTLSQKSLRTFQRHFLPKTMKQFTFENLRAAYRGGRCELFKQGVYKSVRVYDVNSLYPYVMLNHSFPYPGYYFNTYEIIPLGIYSIDVKIKKDIDIPVLGIINENKFIFPTGSFSGTFTGAELLLAQKENQIEDITVNVGIGFDEFGHIFHDFMTYFYMQKIKSEFEKKMIKVFMNSLYGKFAQGKIIKEYDPVNDIFINKEKNEFPNHTNFIWSIFITSFARIKLFNLMKSVPYESLLYVDTDSLHLLNCKLNDYLIGTEIGQLKFEGFFEQAYYLLPKTYAFFQGQNMIKTVCKGIPKEKHKEFILNKRTTFKKPVRLKEFLYSRAFNLNKFGDKMPKLNEWVEFKKEINAVYGKRIVLENGNTKPLILDF